MIHRNRCYDLVVPNLQYDSDNTMAKMSLHIILPAGLSRILDDLHHGDSSASRLT